MIDPGFILMIVLMFAMMYFFMIRPENKRKKEAQNLRDSLIHPPMRDPLPPRTVR